MEGVERLKPTAIRDCDENCSGCIALRLEIEKSKSEYRELEAKLWNLEAQIMALRGQGVGGMGKMDTGVCVDREGGVEEEEDKVFQLMVENKILECEKNKAESEVQLWKDKYAELELQFSTNGANSSAGIYTANVNVTLDGCRGAEEGRILEDDKLACIGLLSNASKLNSSTPSIGGEIESYLKPEGVRSSVIRKRLLFGEDRSPNKRIAPSTPGGVQPVLRGVINICDSDDESTKMDVLDDLGKEKTESLADYVPNGTFSVGVLKDSENYSNRVVNNENYPVDTGVCEDDISNVVTPNRKRPYKVVVSDSETDEDNVPICMLKVLRLRESGHDNTNSGSTTAAPSITSAARPSRRRLVKLQQIKDNCKAESSSKNDEAKYKRGIPTTEAAEDTEFKEAASDGESGSMNSFIVDTSDMSDEKESSGHSDNGSDEEETSDHSGEGSDDNVSFGEILSRIRRRKHCKFKWEFEADMLADFGEDIELCMRAVCALYRQQTSEEQAVKLTFVNNGRGFNSLDAERGSTLAQFIMGEDPLGDIQRSVQELQEYDRKAIEDCRRLATRYSKQLFQIYKNKEDPMFLP